MNRQHDIEPYWQNEDDWLCTVEFLPSNDPEGRGFAATFFRSDWITAIPLL